MDQFIFFQTDRLALPGRRAGLKKERGRPEFGNLFFSVFKHFN